MEEVAPKSPKTELVSRMVPHTVTEMEERTEFVVGASIGTMPADVLAPAVYFIRSKEGPLEPSADDEDTVQDEMASWVEYG